MNTSGVTIETSGVLFTNPDPVITRNGELIAAETGRFGAEMVRDALDDVLVNPTGNYRAAVTSTVVGELVQITDSGVIYGPWLEGVGARNERSRFKGYSTFRRTLPRIDAEIPVRTALIQERMARELEA